MGTKHLSKILHRDDPRNPVEDGDDKRSRMC